MESQITTQSDKDLWSIEGIEKTAVYLTIIALAAVLYFWFEWGAVLGLLAGSTIGVFNFRLIARAVNKMFADEESSSKNGIRYGVKVLALIGIIGVLIIGVKVNAAAFLVGFSTIVLAMIFEGIKNLF